MRGAGDNCDENAQCINTVGSFNCSCNPGYSGDGITCNGMFFIFIFTQNNRR